jgi:hypothetical protein
MTNKQVRRKTYAEKALKKAGFEPQVVEETAEEGKDRTIVLRVNGFDFVFVCMCPMYPGILSMECPLHHYHEGWFPCQSQQVTDVISTLRAISPT